MAVTITDNRTIVSEGDSTTNWTSSTGKTQLYTSDPAPVEQTASIGHTVDRATEDIYYAMTSADLSDTLVYVWTLANGIMDTLANGGVALVLGDGTNRVGFHLAGSDAAVFRHEDGSVGWQCLVLDTSKLPTTYYTEYAGSYASLDLTAITQIGAGHKTLAKALGGTENCFTDILRHGVSGLTITGGTSGTDPGTFQDIADEDVSSTSQKAYGIIRKYTAGSFGVQGPLYFGGSSDTWFEDSDVSVTFENRFIGDDKYKLVVESNSTSSGVFKLSSATIASAGPNVTVDMSSNDIDILELDGIVFTNLGNTVTFPSGGAGTYSITNCKFNACGQIDFGTSTIDVCTISNTTNATSGALLLNNPSGTSNFSDLYFISAGSGHAIYITETGTYSFDGWTFDGYATSNGSTGDEVVYNNSAGSVIINIAGGGDTPTYRNGTGASTTVNNVVNVTVSNLKDNSEVRVYASGTHTEIAGTENATNGTTDNRWFKFSSNAGNVVNIVVHNLSYKWLVIENYTIPTTDTSIPVQQIIDRDYSNP